MKGKPVYVVCCYQTIIGVYESMDDACQVARELIAKNRPADICTQLIK